MNDFGTIIEDLSPTQLDPDVLDWDEDNTDDLLAELL